MRDPMDRPALRIVHLTGGYRAFDLGDDDIRIGPDFQRHMLKIPTPTYNALYRALISIGLQPIGVDFIASRAQVEMNLPPDFQTFSSSSGFAALKAERAWSDVKNVPEQRTSEIFDFSGRFATYHRLLTLRIRELSEAYRGCLVAQLTDIDGKYKSPVDRALFSNGFQLYIEAALHAFLADAAGMRDLIAEAVWRLVLGEVATDVTTLSAFLKKTRTRQADSPLVAEVHSAGAADGWLKVLTDLRNAVTHIAPLANAHELHMSQVRHQPLQGGSIPVVHYPMLRADGTARTRSERIDLDDGQRREVQVRRYRDFVNESGDGLAYAVACADRLVTLSARVRQTAGLEHRMHEITDADIVGEVRVHRPGQNERP